MACCGHLGTLLVILLFTADIFTDVATGVELLLNDHPYCKLPLLSLSIFLKYHELSKHGLG